MRRERFDKMNVVPFIDIVLVLLVIVLATASFVQYKSLKVDLPKANSDKPLERQSHTLTIDQNGTYYFDAKPIDKTQLAKRIKALNPKKDTLTLHTDKKTPFEYFVTAIDLLKSQGFQNVSVVTK